MLRDSSDELLKHVKLTDKSILDNIDRLLDDTSDEEISEVSEMCSKIVGKIVFMDTRFDKFIESMDKYKESTKGLSTNDIAALATVDLVVDFLIEQVEVKG